MGTQFVVEGAEKDTGIEQQLVLEADDAEEAERTANARGLFVYAVRPVESTVPSMSPVDAIGNVDAVCPYCNHDLDKKPGRKKKCPHCGQSIHALTRPSDGEKVLVTEAQAEQIAEQWFVARGGTHDGYLSAQARAKEERERLAVRLAQTKDPLETARLLLAHGKGWMEVVRTISKAGIPRTEANAVTRIAVTEWRRAQAERHLDEMEYLGVEDAPAQVEWSTAGDDGVCPACAALNGNVFTVEQARGMMPHARCTSEDGCRCSWSPVLG